MAYLDNSAQRQQYNPNYYVPQTDQSQYVQLYDPALYTGPFTSPAGRAPERQQMLYRGPQMPPQRPQPQQYLVPNASGLYTPQTIYPPEYTMNQNHHGMRENIRQPLHPQQRMVQQMQHQQMQHQQMQHQQMQHQQMQHQQMQHQQMQHQQMQQRQDAQYWYNAQAGQSHFPPQVDYNQHVMQHQQVQQRVRQPWNNQFREVRAENMTNVPPYNRHIQEGRTWEMPTGYRRTGRKNNFRGETFRPSHMKYNPHHTQHHTPQNIPQQHVPQHAPQHVPHHAPHQTPHHMQHMQQQHPTMPMRSPQSNLPMSHAQSKINLSGTGSAMDRTGKWRSTGGNVPLGTQKWKSNHAIPIDNVVNPNFNKTKESPIKQSPTELRQQALRQPVRPHGPSSGAHKKFVPQFDPLPNSHFESRPPNQQAKIQNEFVEKEKKMIPPRPLRPTTFKSNIVPEVTRAPDIEPKSESNMPAQVIFKPEAPAHLGATTNRPYDYAANAPPRNQGIDFKKEQDLTQAVQNVELGNSKINDVVEEGILANQTPCIPLPTGTRTRKILTTVAEKKEIIPAGSQSISQKSAWNMKPIESSNPKSAWNTVPAPQKPTAWNSQHSSINSVGKDSTQLAENPNNSGGTAWNTTKNDVHGKVPQTENPIGSMQKENMLLPQQEKVPTFSNIPWMNLPKDSDPPMITRDMLPVRKNREQIVQAIRDHRVLVISGDTGSGKTTQIPQFVLEEGMVPEGKIIVCTQPRRLATISIAERVASERNSQVGREIGYQVRFLKEVSEETQLVFCTTAILLRKLHDDRVLSHIGILIVDEVHERDIYTDFLLIVLRDLIHRGKLQMKLILMSATLNAKTFRDHFTGGGITPHLLSIGGFAFDVQQYFLEDALEWTQHKLHHLQNTPEDRIREIDETLNEKGFRYSPETARMVASYNETDVQHGLIKELIKLICDSGIPGAVLVFFPGWADISRMHDALDKEFGHGLWILTLHSMVALDEQKHVFERPPAGKRKIVLSTNIAETSITIDDVVFVIDSGVIKRRKYNPKLNTAPLETTLVARASATQRKGRAGRCREGVAIHLFPKFRMQNLVAEPIPAMLSNSLEDVVLQVKALHLEEMDVCGFLNYGLSSPSSLAVDNAIGLLKEMKLLDPTNAMLPMGQILAQIPVHPMEGKASLIAAMLGVLRLTSIIIGFCAHKMPFARSKNANQLHDSGKKFLAGNSNSDHYAILSVFIEWDHAVRPQDVVEKHVLSEDTMDMVKLLSEQISNLIHGDVPLLTPEHTPSIQSDEWLLVVLSLTMGFYPRVVYCGREYGRTVLQSTDFSDKIEAGRSSVNAEVYRRCQGYWYIYTGYLKLKFTMLFDSTRITLPFIIFAANAVEWREQDKILQFDAWEAELTGSMADRIPELLDARTQMISATIKACNTASDNRRRDKTLKMETIDKGLIQQVIGLLKLDWCDANVYPSDKPLENANPEYARCRVESRKSGGLLGGFGGEDRRDRRNFSQSRRGGYNNQRRNYNNNFGQNNQRRNQGGYGRGNSFGGRRNFRGTNERWRR